MCLSSKQLNFIKKAIFPIILSHLPFPGWQSHPPDLTLRRIFCHRSHLVPWWDPQAAGLERFLSHVLALVPYLPQDQRFLISLHSVSLLTEHAYQFETKLLHKCSWDQSTDLKYGTKEVFLWAICWRDFVLPFRLVPRWYAFLQH